jgi:hypothetical protein
MAVCGLIVIAEYREYFVRTVDYGRLMGDYGRLMGDPDALR